MIKRCLKISLFILTLLTARVSAFISVSTETISFGEQSSTAGYIVSDTYIRINFDKESFETYLEIYTDNKNYYSLDGLKDRSTGETGLYSGLIATNTKTGKYFDRINLHWHLAEDLETTPDPEDDWYDIKDKGDDDWDIHKGTLPTSVELSDTTLAGRTTAHIYIRGDFDEVSAGNYATVINLDFWSEQPGTLILDEKTETVGTGGGTIELANGTYVKIPPGALERDEEITIEKLNPEHPDFPRFASHSRAIKDTPEALYRLSPKGLKFKKPVEIRLVFGDYKSFHDYKIFRRDEFFDEWDFLGGRTGKRAGEHYVSVDIRSFSYYSVYAVEDLRASDFRPKNKIITPHDSAVNVVAEFRGLGDQDTEIKILDITGRHVRTLKDSPYIWDAKDENGRTVESGIYIYQFDAEIEGETELVSGVIAVAK